MRHSNPPLLQHLEDKPPLFSFPAGNKAVIQDRLHLIIASAKSQKKGKAVLLRVPLQPVQVEKREL